MDLVKSWVGDQHLEKISEDLPRWGIDQSHIDFDLHGKKSATTNPCDPYYGISFNDLMLALFAPRRPYSWAGIEKLLKGKLLTWVRSHFGDVATLDDRAFLQRAVNEVIGGSSTPEQTRALHVMVYLVILHNCKDSRSNGAVKDPGLPPHHPKFDPAKPETLVMRINLVSVGSIVGTDTFYFPHNIMARNYIDGNHWGTLMCPYDSQGAQNICVKCGGGVPKDHVHPDTDLCLLCATTTTGAPGPEPMISFHVKAHFLQMWYEVQPHWERGKVEYCEEEPNFWCKLRPRNEIDYYFQPKRYSFKDSTTNPETNQLTNNTLRMTLEDTIISKLVIDAYSARTAMERSVWEFVINKMVKRGISIYITYKQH